MYDVHIFIIFQTHIGIKGLVTNGISGEPLPNTIIHVKNITDSKSVDIMHDVTSGSTTYFFINIGRYA